MAAAEVATRALPPTAIETTPAMGGMEGIMAKRPSDAMAVAKDTGRELSLALTSESHHPPARDEPLLRCVSPSDLSSELFTLDDAAEGMEREKLSEGFTATLEALNQAKYSLGLASRSLFPSSIFVF